jgi:hypothetical protein
MIAGDIRARARTPPRLQIVYRLKPILQGEVPDLRDALLQISADDLDYVLGGFFGGFGILRHVIEDVVLHELGHQAVDGAASSGQAVKHFGALLVLIEAFEDGFQLADDFLGAVDEIQFFSGRMRHFA